MALKPPQHRADAPGRFIARQDAAWDMDGIAPSADHPLMRYFAGDTRFDLQAVRGFLRSDVQPTVFMLRRLTLAEYAAVQDIPGLHQRFARAAAIGVTGVENGAELGFLADRWRPDDVERAFNIDDQLPFEIGMAVVNYSRPISEAEGKRSGSGGGASNPSGPGSDGSK